MNLLVTNFHGCKLAFHQPRTPEIFQFFLLLLSLMILQLYHLPCPLPAAVSDSSLVTLCQPLQATCCTVLLYFSRYCTVGIKKFLFLLFCFAFLRCCLWEKYYTAITMQYYLVDCVSWVPMLTLLDLLTNWTYEHSPNRPYSYVGELLSITTFLIPQGYLVY